MQDNGKTELVFRPSKDRIMDNIGSAIESLTIAHSMALELNPLAGSVPAVMELARVAADLRTVMLQVSKLQLGERT